MTHTDNTPRLYVACLAAYNSGILYGKWIEALSAEQIREDIAAMLAASPEPYAEEWAIHDYEGFGACHISEHSCLEYVAELAELLQSHPLAADVLAHVDDDTGRARAVLEDYCGEYFSPGDFAEQLHEDTVSSIPASLRVYINWDDIARDMEINGEIILISPAYNVTHVFWNN